eukprot:CAMPEP_0176503418 /NCGR_PEP_ID=MMETSP0200_2-20121128/15351_1 /TAXON_ID=947934 /ORGANISM="Chaetoceros sp., Strain GSL56" /LENGTH=630 /DNA_ID=CAMNT_0017902705 /DNA_START=60 /DNA_END=1952 /DNA_ORIENTATION=-
MSNSTNSSSNKTSFGDKISEKKIQQDEQQEEAANEKEQGGKEEGGEEGYEDEKTHRRQKRKQEEGSALRGQFSRPHRHTDTSYQEECDQRRHEPPHAQQAAAARTHQAPPPPPAESASPFHQKLNQDVDESDDKKPPEIREIATITNPFDNQDGTSNTRSTAVQEHIALQHQSRGQTTNTILARNHSSTRECSSDSTHRPPPRESGDALNNSSVKKNVSNSIPLSSRRPTITCASGAADVGSTGVSNTRREDADTSRRAPHELFEAKHSGAAHHMEGKGEVSSKQQQIEESVAEDDVSTTNASITVDRKDEQMLDCSSLPDAEDKEEQLRSDHKTISNRERRLAMNRATAKVRRDRKLQYLSDLEEQVQNMIESNNMFISQNNEMREQIVNLKNDISLLQQMGSPSNSSMTPQSFVPEGNIIGGTSLPTSRHIDQQQQRAFLGANPSFDFLQQLQHGNNPLSSIATPHELINSIAVAESRNLSLVELRGIAQQQPYLQQQQSTTNLNNNHNNDDLTSMPCSQNMSSRTSLSSLATSSAGINQTTTSVGDGATSTTLSIAGSHDEIPEKPRHFPNPGRTNQLPAVSSRITSVTAYGRSSLHDQNTAPPVSTRFGSSEQMEQNQEQEEDDEE